MNILVSYNWMKDYMKTRVSPEDLARRLSLSGPSVERIMRVPEHLDNVVVGKIIKVKPHPNADKLRVVETDIGPEKKDIVCGGSNLEEGHLVAVALPGAHVRWHGEGEPMKIDIAELRGVESYGMIAAANEIGLLDMFPHEEREILDLTAAGVKAKPGAPLAKALGLEDTIFDVEVTTNRPDAFSIVGMAREAAAVLETDFTWNPPTLKLRRTKTDDLPLKITVKNKNLCPRYQAVVMKNVKVGPSPVWLKRRLASAGLNSINNVVDITNYVLLELAQPLHAFDYETLKDKHIVVREAEEGEKIKALDDETYTLKKGQLVIADAERPVAVAGVMGGRETGVSDATTTIVFESANFEPVQVRRTSRDLHLMSDSQQRFEKGLSTESTAPALAEAMRLAEELCGAEVASEVFDIRKGSYKPLKYDFRSEAAATLIGIDLSVKKMRSILESLGFSVSGSGKKWKVEVPYWRDQDIEGERDLTEEIARVYGYDNLPSVIPAGELPLPPRQKSLAWEDRLKLLLKDWGSTELMTYSFISKDLMEKVGDDPSQALKLANPLTEDLEYMRMTLVGSVLDVVARNQDEVPAAHAFEAANVYLPREGELPEERGRLALISWSRDQKGYDVRRVKGTVEALADEFGLDIAFESSDNPGALWHPGRAAAVLLDGLSVGMLGEVHPVILKRFGIERRVAMADLDLDALLERANARKSYTPIPEFPRAKRDLAFMLDRKTRHREVREVLLGAHALVRKAELFDVFEGGDLPEGKKSMAYHLSFGHPERTLSSEEVDGAMEDLKLTLKERFNADLRT